MVTAGELRAAEGCQHQTQRTQRRERPYAKHPLPQSRIGRT
jgi:hypothetical protein